MAVRHLLRRACDAGSIRVRRVAQFVVLLLPGAMSGSDTELTALAER